MPSASREIYTMEVPISPLCGSVLKLPGKLDRLLCHSCILPKGVENEIPLIKHDLEKITTILSALEDDQGMIARCWVKEVRELSYDMEDFIDQYEHAAARSIPRRRKITQRRKSKTSLHWVREKLRKRLWMANKIREFSRRTQEALQRHDLYKLDTVAASGSTTRYTDAHPASWHSTPHGEDSSPLVGIDASMDRLEEWLMTTDDEGHQKLKVVSIVGFGGIGKTTHANELYHKLGWKFECRAFVRTSRKPDMRRVFISMLSQIRPQQPPSSWTVHCLISTIRTHLQDKRYFIIVEDLWATSTWDIIKCALPDGNSCSRILITTENEDLALQSCGYDPNYMFKMKPLGADDSRKLFFGSIFGPQHECPPELRKVSDDIIRKCDGSPLAIVTIASILTSQPRIQHLWDDVNKSLDYSLLNKPTSEGMKQVLSLIYNNLPQHLKACMLYTSLYEEDIIIWKDDLINQWIAEGFILAPHGQDKKEIAVSFFERLIRRKLIQPVDINNNGEVLSCVVHHLVLKHVIADKSTEENFMTAIHHSQATTTLADKVRRLSHQFGNLEDATPPTNMRLAQVRTLAFFGVFNCMPSIVEFRLLQVLILDFWGDKDSISLDLTGVSELFRLRYLKVTSNVTLELCIQMRGLRCLETCTIGARVSAVPSDIVHLPGLLHLSLPAQTNLPDGIGHLTSLRTLGYFDLSNNSMENVQMFSMLTNLRDLQLTCCGNVQEAHNLKCKMEFLLGSVLGKLGNLKSLTLLVPTASSDPNSLADNGAPRITISSASMLPTLLETLQFAPRICIFSCLPKSMEQFGNLRIFKIGVEKITKDDVSVLGRLPALAVLSLFVYTKPEERIAIGKDEGFSVLKNLKFSCCDPWLKFEQGAMPKLQKLKLSFSYRRADILSLIPVGIDHLSGLGEISAKIRGAGPEESHRRAAELAFRDAIIKAHTRCPRVTIRCLSQIAAYKEEQSSDMGMEDKIMEEEEEEEEAQEEEKKHARYRFYPTEEELICFYLRHKLDNLRHDIERVIPVVDVYSYDPAQLPEIYEALCGGAGEGEPWFYFCPRQEREARGGRPSRTTPSGYWKAAGTLGLVYSADRRAIGMKKTMVFYSGRAPLGTKTKWKMNEYRALQYDAAAAIGTDGSSSGAHAAAAAAPPPVTNLRVQLRSEFSLCRLYTKSQTLRQFDCPTLADAATAGPSKDPCVSGSGPGIVKEEEEQSSGPVGLALARILAALPKRRNSPVGPLDQEEA